MYVIMICASKTCENSHMVSREVTALNTQTLKRMRLFVRKGSINEPQCVEIRFDHLAEI